jgi:3-hydroxyacyl-[acyl-carrier-protein] dehydratase
VTRVRLDLGPETVAELLPQRPPMRFVDGVDELLLGPPPTLRASLRLDPADPILQGHFPGRPLWPGALLVEGLAQTAQLLLALATAPTAALDALREGHLERVERREGLLAAIDVKLTRPVTVLSPVRIDYRATFLDTRLGMARCEVEAHVAGSVVGRGRLTLAGEP